MFIIPPQYLNACSAKDTVHYREYFYWILQTIKITHLSSLLLSFFKGHFVSTSKHLVSLLMQREMLLHLSNSLVPSTLQRLGNNQSGGSIDRQL